MKPLVAVLSSISRIPNERKSVSTNQKKSIGVYHTPIGGKELRSIIFIETDRKTKISRGGTVLKGRLLLLRRSLDDDRHSPRDENCSGSAAALCAAGGSCC